MSHYSDIIMSAMESQITGVSVVCSAACSGADQRKHQSPTSLGLCEGNPPVTSGFPSQRASNAKKFPFVIMCIRVLMYVVEIMSSAVYDWPSGCFVPILRVLALVSAYLRLIHFVSKNFLPKEQELVMCQKFSREIWYHAIDEYSVRCSVSKEIRHVS